MTARKFEMSALAYVRMLGWGELTADHALHNSDCGDERVQAKRAGGVGYKKASDLNLEGCYVGNEQKSEMNVSACAFDQDDDEVQEVTYATYAMMSEVLVQLLLTASIRFTPA